MVADSSWFSCIPMAVFNTASLTGTYASLNGTGFSSDIKLLKIFNGSNVGITISYDNGVTDHDYFPPNSTFIIDLQANHADTSSYGSGTLYGRTGQIIMGKGSAGTGNFYISGYR